MTRLVEISAESVAGVRSDVVATRDAVHGLGSLRSRAWALGVDVSGFDKARWVADRLDTSVLPVVDVHLARARDLEDLRYGGPVGCAIPVVDAAPDPFTVPPSMFTQAPGGAGTVLSWEPASLEEQAADAAATAGAQSLGDWFSGHWDDVAGAVDEGVDRLAAGAVEAWDEGVDRLAAGAVEAWNAVTERGAEIGGWWETWTADRGAWVDENLAGVREFIGTHVAGFRVAASVCRVLGWVVVAAGAVLTVGLAVIGAMGGAAIGAVFGFGVGAVPAGGAGAAAGAAYGLKVLGAGFSIVSVGDFLDVAADWGEGTIDGQELVQKGSLELALAVGSFVGAGALGKILQKAATRLPASWRMRMDDAVRRFFTPARAPQDEASRLAPLRGGAVAGPGWTRASDYGPDPLYGQARPGAVLLDASEVPAAVNPGVASLGGSLDDLWGTDPSTGLRFTEAQWAERFATDTGGIRWPPNGGAVPGTRVLFHDLEEFISIYGNEVDRIGAEGGGYLGIPPGVSFEQRALPSTTLGEGLHAYSFTGKLPPGVTIEVSEIAPAFGRPGGGLQIRFMEGAKSMIVSELRRKGVIR